MTDYQKIFRRYEMKYLLNENTYEKLIEKLDGRMSADLYGNSTVCNIYFDTPDFRLIRTSLEKPVYKEKLRLRSYETPGDGSDVFVEIKKKYKGIVYKRRETMALSEAELYLSGKGRPRQDSQVLHEIDWILNYYGQLIPAMYISYERTALCCGETPDLRITFDSGILWRMSNLDLRRGSWGIPILGNGQRLMEIKIPDTIPLWLSEILDGLHIRPVSFSKYGNAYQMAMKQITEQRGGKNCA